MGLFERFLKKNESAKEDNECLFDKKLSDMLVQFVIKCLQDNSNRVRAEDAICLISTIVAERCIDAAGDYDLRNHEFIPGSRVFSDKINNILCGNYTEDDISLLSRESVFGMIRDNLKDYYAIQDFPKLSKIFQYFANMLGDEKDWGKVPLSIPEDNYPILLPLRVGYETRLTIDKLFEQILEDRFRCLKISVIALSEIFKMVRDIIDPRIALSLGFEMINGMTKTAPMTEKEMRKVEENS